SLKEELMGEISVEDIPNEKLIVLCVYRTQKANITKFIQKIEEPRNLNTDCKQYRNYKIAVARDFNVDILENTRESKELKNIFGSYNCKSTLFEP
ncbi:hypothetical protein HHI36_010908, partial [Cryptolaemus montrouzieri]